MSGSLIFMGQLKSFSLKIGLLIGFYRQCNGFEDFDINFCNLSVKFAIVKVKFLSYFIFLIALERRSRFRTSVLSDLYCSHFAVLFSLCVANSIKHSYNQLGSPLIRGNIFIIKSIAA